MLVKTMTVINDGEFITITAEEALQDLKNATKEFEAKGSTNPRMEALIEFSQMYGQKYADWVEKLDGENERLKAKNEELLVDNDELMAENEKLKAKMEWSDEQERKYVERDAYGFEYCSNAEDEWELE